jgi:hypothetical protein
MDCAASLGVDQQNCVKSKTRGHGLDAHSDAWVMLNTLRANGVPRTMRKRASDR